MVDPKSYKVGTRVFVKNDPKSLFTNDLVTHIAKVAQGQCASGKVSVLDDSYSPGRPKNVCVAVISDLRLGTRIFFYPVPQFRPYYASGSIAVGQCKKAEIAIHLNGKQYPAKKPYDCVEAEKLDPASVGPVQGSELLSASQVTPNSVTNSKGDRFIDEGAVMIQPGPGRTMDDVDKNR